MIIEFELVKHEDDQVTKRLAHSIVSDDNFNSDTYMRCPNEVEELIRDGYAIEYIRTIDSSQKLK